MIRAILLFMLSDIIMLRLGIIALSIYIGGSVALSGYKVAAGQCGKPLIAEQFFAGNLLCPWEKK